MFEVSVRWKYFCDECGMLLGEMWFWWGFFVFIIVWKWWCGVIWIVVIG